MNSIHLDEYGDTFDGSIATPSIQSESNGSAACSAISCESYPAIVPAASAPVSTQSLVPASKVQAPSFSGHGGFYGKVGAYRRNQYKYFRNTHNKYDHRYGHIQKGGKNNQ